MQHRSLNFGTVIHEEEVYKKRGGTFVSPFSGVSFPSKSTVPRLVTNFATVMCEKKKLERTGPVFLIGNVEYFF